MKKWILLLCLCAGIGASAQTDKPVDSRISRVTVFLNRAQITREVKTRLEAGKTNLVLSGLTAQLDPGSIQVSGKGSVLILGISHRQNFLNELTLPRSLRVLKDSIEVYRKAIAVEQNQKDIFAKEEQLLLSNQKIGGSAQNLTVNELKAMADFYRVRLGELGLARVKSDEKLKQLNEKLTKLNQQLAEQNELYSRNTSEITVSLSVETATAVELEISYVVTNAGWYPVYDVRSTGTKGPLSLNYKAGVYQGTGEEWNQVKLKLSTANPSLGGVKPELYSWYLDIEPPVVYAPKNVSRSAAYKQKPAEMSSVPVADKEELDEVVTVADHVTTVQTSLTTEFDIGLPYTVVSSSKPTLVDIRNHSVNAAYAYAATPKLDGDAFLMARATGWEEFNLLPGEAHVFFENTFVGDTYIDPQSVKDTLQFSLGRDKRVVVKREKTRDYTSRKAIGASIREAYGWEISVRNTRTEPITITVEDQVPVSVNSQVEVAVTEVGGARYTKETGKLVWELNLQPNETRKVNFRYEVKYPKDKRVSGL